MTQPELLTFARYPEVPGARATDTSRKAAVEIEADAATLRNQVYALLLVAGPHTADEVAELIGESVLAIRPRMSELRAFGKVSDTGHRRPNQSGKSAIVWKAVNATNNA